MTTLPQTAPMRLPRPVVPSQLALPGPAHHAPSHAPAAAHLSGADVWRVIRSHMWLIVIAVMASAVLGYLANSYLAKNYSRFTAEGLVGVKGKSEMPMPGQPARDPDPSAVGLAQATHSRMIEHESLFTDTIQAQESPIRTTKWWTSFNGHLDLAKASLAQNLTASPIAQTNLIRVRMTAATPEDTKIIIEDLINAHIEKTKEDQRAIEQRKVEMLVREARSIELDLDENVIKPLREKELMLGNDTVGTFMNYNGKQLQLDRLLNEQTKIQSELAGWNARRETLELDLREGRTPAEVEDRLSRDGRYLNAKSYVDELEIGLEQLVQELGEHHQRVVQTKRMLEARRAKMDEIYEEMKSNYAENLKTIYRNEINASVANAQRIQEQIGRVSQQLGELNKAMNDYRVLQTREMDLRKKLQTTQDEIGRIRQFVLAAPWASAEWARRPQKPDRPSFPRLWMSMGVAVMLGLGFSLGIAFLREMTDTTVRSPRDIARVGQLNLLGMIPHEHDDPQTSGSRLQLAIFDAPTSIVAEQFRQLRTRLQHAASLDTTRSILVTSPSAGDGKTTVAANLAAALALNGRRILLVDANFRKPTLHAVFNTGNESGFSDVLNDLDRFEGAARETEVPNLAVVPSGPKPANPTELLESQLLIDFIERALEEYDHVIFDGGPLLVVSDAIALAPRVDGVVTVVRARGNSRGLLMRMRDELRKVKAEHLGVVLNAVRSQGGGYYGRNIKAYYAYQNG